MISEKLKSVIFDKLYQDLKHCEIIPYDGSIYIIDRDNKFWCFEYDKGGTLWWRYDFFNTFFELFSLTYKQFQPILGEWVEEVLNCKVLTTMNMSFYSNNKVEEILNCKVLTTSRNRYPTEIEIEEVLNCKVLTTRYSDFLPFSLIEEVLNCKVLTTDTRRYRRPSVLEEVLNCNESKT